LVGDRSVVLHLDVNVFEDCAGRNTKKAFGGLHKVVARTSTVLATQRINEGKRLGELFCMDEKASAIRIPMFGHNSAPGSGFRLWPLGPGFRSKCLEESAFSFLSFSGTMNQPAGISFAVIVNLRAEEASVNSQKVVQWEILRSGTFVSLTKVISVESR